VLSDPALVRRQAIRPDPQHLETAVHGDAAKQGVGRGYHLRWTWQLYLAVVLDLFSRKIVGWSAGPTIHRELVPDAVLMAVRRRRPRGAMIHSIKAPRSAATPGGASAALITWSRA
jgi:transposase InsO family protein